MTCSKEPVYRDCDDTLEIFIDRDEEDGNPVVRIVHSDLARESFRIVTSKHFRVAPEDPLPRLRAHVEARVDDVRTQRSGSGTVMVE